MTALVSAALLLTAALPAAAQNVGDTAPAFSYPALGGGEIRLADHSGKVVFVFLFGNTCPFCLAVGNQTETEINNAFGSNPSFQAIGLDMWTSSSTTASVSSFRSRTGITYPLGLQAGGMASLYGTTYDRLVVIGADGVIRYKGTSNVSSTLQAAKSVVNDLLATITLDTEDGPEPTFALQQPYPNPSAGRTTVSYRLRDPGHARLSVVDLLGREVAVLADAFRDASAQHTEWIAEDHLPAGLYLLVLQAGGERTTRPVLLNR